MPGVVVLAGLATWWIGDRHPNFAEADSTRAEEVLQGLNAELPKVCGMDAADYTVDEGSNRIVITQLSGLDSVGELEAELAPLLATEGLEPDIIDYSKAVEVSVRCATP